MFHFYFRNHKYGWEYKNWWIGRGLVGCGFHRLLHFGRLSRRLDRRKEGKESPPEMEFKVCLRSLGQLEQTHIDTLSVLERSEGVETVRCFVSWHITRPWILGNYCDVQGSKTLIRTKNLETINLVKETVDKHHTCKCEVNQDLPGFCVKILPPTWFEPLLAANQFIWVIHLHHPSLNTDS